MIQTLGKLKDTFWAECQDRIKKGVTTDEELKPRWNDFLKEYTTVKNNILAKVQLDQQVARQFDEGIKPIISDRRKSHTRGFSDKKRAEKVNKLIDEINKLIINTHQLDACEKSQKLWKKYLNELRKAFF